MKIKWQDEKIPHMNVKEAGEVTYLTYPAFEKLEGIIHGFSTRLLRCCVSMDSWYV